MTDATMTPAAGGYDTTAKALHWIVAIAVITLILLGIGREFLPKGPIKDAVTFVHKSIGVLVFALMVARLSWRLASPPPPPEPGLPRWQIGLSHAVHWTLYAILLAMPLIGWAGSSAGGHPVSVFGLFTLPSILAKDKDLGEAIFTVHAILGFAAAGLIALHVGAALYHRFARRDAVLARML